MSPDHLTGATVALAVASIVGLARWVGASRAREGASDATTSATAATLAKIDAKPDRVVDAIGEMRVTATRIETEHAGTVDRITRAEDRISAISARLDAIDAKHTEARHAQTAHLTTMVAEIMRGAGDHAASR